MLTDHDRDFLRLLARSPDRGDGWRYISDACWLLVEQFEAKELLEIDNDFRRVRLTTKGQNVVKFVI